MPGSKRKGVDQPGASKKKRVRQRRKPVLCDCGCGQTVFPSTRSKHRAAQAEPAPVLAPSPVPVPPPVAAVAVPPAPAPGPAAAVPVVPVAPVAAPLAFGDDDDELPELLDSDDEEEGGNALAQQGQGGHDHHADCQLHNLNQQIQPLTAAQKYVHVLVEEQIRTGASQESVVRAAKVISSLYICALIACHTFAYIYVLSLYINVLLAYCRRSISTSVKRGPRNVQCLSRTTRFCVSRISL